MRADVVEDPEGDLVTYVDSVHDRAQAVKAAIADTEARVRRETFSQAVALMRRAAQFVTTAHVGAQMETWMRDEFARDAVPPTAQPTTAEEQWASEVWQEKLRSQRQAVRNETWGEALVVLDEFALGLPKAWVDLMTEATESVAVRMLQSLRKAMRSARDAVPPAMQPPPTTGTGWVRYRFSTKEEDYRPVKWPPAGPYWCSGYWGDNAILIAYLPHGALLQDYWPEVAEVESTEVAEIAYTDRFPRPDWWQPKSAPAPAPQPASATPQPQEATETVTTSDQTRKMVAEVSDDWLSRNPEAATEVRQGLAQEGTIDRGAFALDVAPCPPRGRCYGRRR